MGIQDKNHADKNRGRGAVSNTPNRFEKNHLAPLDPSETEDRYEDDPVEGAATASPRRPDTLFLKDKSRSILTENDSPDVGVGVSLNPYRGCEHGCIYCYARPTHEYLGFSAGIEFETRIMVKSDAPELLRKSLMAPKWEPQSVTLSGVTDCYQPVERRLRLTRRCLEVLQEFGNPFVTISKNHLVTRDIDIIGEMAKQKAAASFVTVTSLDAKLCGTLEPRTSRPKMRLQAIHELSQAGIPVGVMVAPVIPGLTDHELPAILAEAAAHGAIFAGYTIVRLPHSVSPLFSEWLSKHFPERSEKVLGLIRSVRGGKLNDPNFGTRMTGLGPYAEQIRSLFKIHCRKNGLNKERLALSTEAFKRPGEQLKFF
jgi:DNA repair photolyase